jgi:holo-[acyl-carrier protein] synthase
MIVGIGLDLVELSRARASLGRWGDHLVEKLMDPEEAARLAALHPDRTHAVAFSIALKEAGSKAIGTGWSRGVRWRDVIVEPGPPVRVRLTHEALRVAQRLGSSGANRAWLETRDDLVLGEVWLLAAGAGEAP